MSFIGVWVGCGFKHFNSEGRRNWQNPEELLAESGLKEGQTFVDVGCGDGFFTIPAAKIVGNKGKVYGVDIDEEAVGALTVAARNVGNIVAKIGRAEDTLFCNSCADIVFFGIDLHDFEDPAKVLSNARVMLKPAGRLIDLDWIKEPSQIGPPFWKRLSQNEASELIEKSGFKVEYIKNFRQFYLISAVVD